MFLHYTKPENIDSILFSGLMTDREPDEKGVEWVLSFYDENPVYLTLKGSEFIEVYRDGLWADFVGLEVDTANLPLAADLPSLIDKGARYDSGLLYVAGSQALSDLIRYADEYGWVEIEHLIDPRTDVAAAAIKVTSTAACLCSISPERLSVLFTENIPGCRGL